MKRFLPVALFVFLGCSKHEVDIGALRSNPFDPAWQGTSFLTVDSAITVALVPGAVFQQRIYISLDDRVTAVNDYSVRMIETTLPDTVMGTPTGAPRGQVEIRNNLVQLGQQYCFHFDLLIENQPVFNHRRSSCYIAAQ